MHRLDKLFWKIVDYRLDKLYNDNISFIIVNLYLGIGGEHEL